MKDTSGKKNVRDLPSGWSWERFEVVQAVETGRVERSTKTGLKWFKHVNSWCQMCQCTEARWFGSCQDAGSHVFLVLTGVRSRNRLRVTWFSSAISTGGRAGFVWSLSGRSLRGRFGLPFHRVGPRID